MITNRLQNVKKSILSKRVQTPDDTELLSIIERIDNLENLLASASDNRVGASPVNSRLMLEMIVRPQGKTCDACGRTLK